MMSTLPGLSVTPGVLRGLPRVNLSFTPRFDLFAEEGGAVHDPAALSEELLELVSFEQPYTDFQAADMFHQYVMGRVLWVTDMGCFAVWDGRRWKMRADAELEAALAQFLTGFSVMASQDRAFGGMAATLARKLNTAAFLSSTMAALRVRGHLHRTAEDFDRDGWMLNTPAGTVDLRTGVVVPHAPEHLITKLTAVSPDTRPLEEAAPRFTRFMREIFERAGDTPEEDAELVRFVQAALGYTLTGDRRIHAMMFWYGEGGNGKNTLGDRVMEIAGDYARKLPASELMSSKHERHPTGVAQLRGIRLAMSSEIAQGAYWNDSLIKELTGDEKLAARFMRQDFFEFTQTHKHVIYGNHKPRLGQVDGGMKRRLKLVPFKQDFTGERADATLPALLKAESPGILSWLIEGAAAVHAAGCKLPGCAIVERETEAYFATMDAFGSWVAECCVVDRGVDPKTGVPRAFCGKADAFNSWRLFMRERNEEAGSQTRFGGMMDRAGYALRYLPRFAEEAAGIQHNKVYHGLRLTPEAQALVAGLDAYGRPRPDAGRGAGEAMASGAV
jgi:putative DNA primase/helicase